VDSIAPSAAASRAAHVLHLAPPEPSRLARLALPALAAAAADDARGLRTLILVEDAETAVSVAADAAREVGGGLAPIAALTGTARARRVLGSTVPAAIAIPLGVAAALVARSALPLDGVRQLILAMPDAPDQKATREALEAVMAGVPKGATKTLVAARETAQVEALVERYFFKARRTREATFDGTKPDDRPIHVLATATRARWHALQRLLDEIDPPSAAVLTSDAGTHAEATHALAALGYAADGLVQAIRDDVPAGITLVVIVGVPETTALRAALDAVPTHLIVLCAPREVAGLRAVAGGGQITPWTLEGAFARAESRAATTRARLREILVSGAFAHELQSLTPLLDEYDGSEIAAAALVMASEAARASAPPVPPPAAPRPAPRPREDRPREDRPRSTDRPRGGDRPRDDRPRSSDRPRSYDRPRGDRPTGDRPRGDRPTGDRPRGDRPYSDRPRDDRPRGPRR
jgi:hypothetical protein